MQKLTTEHAKLTEAIDRAKVSAWWDREKLGGEVEDEARGSRGPHATPPAVEGVVLAVNADGLVEISIGSDDGLMKGHALEVVRRGSGVSVWLGRVEVTETSPDKAVCKVLPEFLQRPIQRDDRVTSRLK